MTTRSLKSGYGRKSFGQKIKRTLLLGFNLLILSLGLGSVYLFFRFIGDQIHKREWLVLKHIEVKGNRRLNREEIIAAAQLQNGLTLTNLNPKSLETRLGLVPDLKRVQVLKRYPSRLVIRVEEREPLAVVPLQDPQYIGEDGIVFPIKKGESWDYPLLTGSVRSQELSPPSPTLLRALSTLAYIKHHMPSLYSQISELNLDRERVQLFLRPTGAELILTEFSDTTVWALLNLYLKHRPLTSNLKLNYLDLRFGQTIIEGYRSRNSIDNQLRVQ